MAIRGSLGASRLRLLGQLLTESVLLAVMGGVASLIVARWTLSAISATLPAKVLQDQGRPDEAIACFRRALEIDPNLVGTYNNLGNALHDKERLKEAALCYRQAIKTDPNNAFAHHNLGNVLKGQGKSDQAVVCYKRALAIDPDLAEAHHSLGNVCQDEGRWADAVKHYGQALSLNPDAPELLRPDSGETGRHLLPA